MISTFSSKNFENQKQKNGLFSYSLPLIMTYFEIIWNSSWYLRYMFLEQIYLFISSIKKMVSFISFHFYRL